MHFIFYFASHVISFFRRFDSYVLFFPHMSHTSVFLTTVLIERCVPNRPNTKTPRPGHTSLWPSSYALFRVGPVARLRLAPTVPRSVGGLRVPRPGGDPWVFADCVFDVCHGGGEVDAMRAAALLEA